VAGAKSGVDETQQDAWESESQSSKSDPSGKVRYVSEHKSDKAFTLCDWELALRFV